MASAAMIALPCRLSGSTKTATVPRLGPVPNRGREYPIRRYRYQTLRLIGWPFYRVASAVEWCGHRHEFIPVPDEGEWIHFIPLMGEAK